MSLTTPSARRPPSLTTPPAAAAWLGFTPMADPGRLLIDRAEGCWLVTADGRRLFDGVASLWCNVHGHRHPHIDAAVRDQLDRVAHVTSLGMCCTTTERLAIELTERCPGALNHAFFSSDGSSAVEAAIKMALQYWRQCDRPRPEKTNYLALDLAYHGDTTGGVSLGGIDFFHQIFSPLLFQPLRGPRPCSYRLPPGVDGSSAAEYYASQVESLLAEHHATLAAVVMEPLVQGAAGMLTHPPGFLQRVRALCDRYEVLLIVDEVATGFGRTGELFACQHEGIAPDILCLGKGITGGYLPMAATVATSEIFNAFLDRGGERRQFFHGHTYGGNPLAAAAALASMELFDENQTLAQVRRQSDRIRSRLAVIADHPHVGDIRGRGLMIGIELVRDRERKEPFDAHDRVAANVCARCLERGVWIRPLSEVLVLMPPLVASDEELDFLADTVIQSVEETFARRLST